ncbi:MAG: BlaI/MecI/CopY family transcriptional regulator [Oscillospiraceae bacterium]|nr:BlaI/MecI/CopY family transcriptional regulator [Oscillospiraceae bacterium]
MKELKLGEIETKFANIIWNNEPLPSRTLAELAEAELAWKKSTTYTILKRLCERGIFQNQNGTVTSRLSRTEFYALQSEKFVEETFEGSLPAFIAAFTTRKKLSDAEIDDLQKLIEGMRGQEDA